MRAKPMLFMMAAIVLAGLIVTLAESPSIVAAEDKGKDKNKGKDNGDDKNKGKDNGNDNNKGKQGCKEAYEHDAKHKEPPGGCKDRDSIQGI